MKSGSRTVSWNDFSPVKTAIETHIAQDDVKWLAFDELREEFKSLRKTVTYCSGAIAMLMVLNANHVLDIRPLFRQAQAAEVANAR